MPWYQSVSMVEEIPHQFKICDVQAELVFSVTQGEITYCLPWITGRLFKRKPCPKVFRERQAVKDSNTV